MATLTIRELKKESAAGPVQAETRAQVESVQVKPTRSGGEFLEVKVTDAEEGFTLRVWGDAPQFTDARQLRARAFLALTGEWTSGQYGLEAKNWTMRPLDEEECRTLLGGPTELREKQERDYGYILETTSALDDPRLRELCEAFLREFGERFRRTGAAREYHHARRGGLVEHVAQMMRAAAALCQVYTDANRDLLLTGVLFHDCGKLWENCYDREGFTMPHSVHGELMGHISLGMEVVNRQWRKMMDSDAAAHWLTLEPASDEVRLHLLHLIGAHHGEYQFGSPVLPRTPEAILLHHVDNIDAKLEMMKDCYETSALLAANIFEKRRPLPANLVRPLGVFEKAAEAPAEEEGAGARGDGE